MEDFDREQQEEMQRKVSRYEKYKQTGETAWFDSDNYIDIIDWYGIHNMYDKVDEVTKEAYELFPNNEEVISRYTTYLANQGEFDKAIEITKKAIRQYNTDELQIDLATLYIDSEQKIDKALEILFNILQNDTDNYFIYMLIGRAYLAKEDSVNAEKYLRKALTLNQEDKYLIGCYIDCSFDESLINTTIRTIYELTHKYPFNENLWTALGMLYSKADFVEEALEAFDYASAINPKQHVSHAYKADCLIAKKDYKYAEKELLIALDLLEQKNSDLEFVLVHVYMQQNKYAKAMMLLQEIYEQDNTFHDKIYLMDFILCCYYTNQYEKASILTEELLHTDITPEIFIDFARVLYDHGFQNESENLFASVISDNTEKNIIELAAITFAALKSRDGNTLEAVKIMENTLLELHSCTEDFWYAFLRITCQDKLYDSYTTKTLQLLMALDSFPTYIKENYPEIIDNPNYKRCLKKIYYA